MDKQDQQHQVAEYWNAAPCDSDKSQSPHDSESYYREIERERYSHQSHILEILEWVDWKNKSVLEIGTGVGTDARQLIARGASYNGINVDEGSTEATRRALRTFNLAGQVSVMSATDMHFESATFDNIYSFGVLHHIPDVAAAISEIERVLKPGGFLLFMVYNRSSINYQVEIRHLRRWMLRVLSLPGMIPLLTKLGLPREKLSRHAELYKRFGKLSESEWLSRNTDGPDNPYSVVYGREDIQRLLGQNFRLLRNEVRYFDWRHWGLIGRVLPKKVGHWLGHRWGWHRIVLAKRK